MPARPGGLRERRLLTRLRRRRSLRATCFVLLASVPVACDSGAAAQSGSVSLQEVASPAERELWKSRSCLLCHGDEAQGTRLGPPLQETIAAYAALPDGAERLAAYLLAPTRAETLRPPGDTAYEVKMPALTEVKGTADEAPVLADLMLRLVRGQ